MPSTPTRRIAAISQHLHSPATPTEGTTSTPTPTPTPTMADPKPPITCHVLDTTLGRPAPSIPVTLTLHTTSPLTFSGTTNPDGRVTSWTPATPFSTLSLADAFAQPGDQTYSLTFDTEAYFGERGVSTFFPEVQVRFCVRGEAKGEHFHVPVLLGPFGYTTYRGS